MQKKEFIEKFNKYWDSEFLCEITSDNRIIFESDISLFIDIKFKNKKEKDYIFDLLFNVIKSFDFSYTLEFTDIEELEFFAK